MEGSTLWAQFPLNDACLSIYFPAMSTALRRPATTQNSHWSLSEFQDVRKLLILVFEGQLLQTKCMYVYVFMYMYVCMYACMYVCMVRSGKVRQGYVYV